jgi:hypothetical protein
MTASQLELAVGGMPFPHGADDGSWCYRHAVRPEGPTVLDHQALTDFLLYERTHGREVVVTADPSLADWQSWRPPSERIGPAAFPIQCCTHAFTSGCGADLVCHGAPPDVAAKILTGGVLRSASSVTGRSGEDLAASSTWGEPPDYFDHVMLANGRCTAPEAVAHSRRLGRDLVPSDLGAGYPPAVRLYFDWKSLIARPDARFDGVHPVKIFDALPLDDTLVAAVVHPSQRDVVEPSVANQLRDRLIVVDAVSPRPDEWSKAALAAAGR